MRLGRLGINVGTDPVFEPADISNAGFNLVRIILQPHVPLHDYIDNCHGQGVQVLGLVTSSSLVAREEDGSERQMSFEEAADVYSASYGDRLDYWEIGNESDRNPDEFSDGSWCLPPEECSHLIQAFVSAIRAQRPDAYITGPGLVSGQPDYVAQLDKSGLNAISIHPYDQTPESAKVLFEHNYGDWVREGGRIFLSEFGLAEPDPEVRGAYLRDMVEQFRQLEYVEAAVWYCWARIQHERPFFVVDYDEQGVVVPTSLCDVCREFGFVPPVFA